MALHSPTLAICRYRASHLVFPPSSSSSHGTWTAAIQRLGRPMLAEQGQWWDTHILVGRLGAWPCIVRVVHSTHRPCTLALLPVYLLPEDTKLPQLKSEMLQLLAIKTINPACLILEFPSTTCEGHVICLSTLSLSLQLPHNIGNIIFPTLQMKRVKVSDWPKATPPDKWLNWD